MKITHLFTATAVTLGGAIVAAAPAQGAIADVIVVNGGAACPSGYGEIAQLDQTTVCYDLNIPERKVITNGDPCNDWWDSGWTEYSVADTVRVCVRW